MSVRPADGSGSMDSVPPTRDDSPSAIPADSATDRAAGIGAEGLGTGRSTQSVKCSRKGIQKALESHSSYLPKFVQGIRNAWRNVSLLKQETGDKIQVKEGRINVDQAGLKGLNRRQTGVLMKELFERLDSELGKDLPDANVITSLRQVIDTIHDFGTADQQEVAAVFIAREQANKDFLEDIKTKLDSKEEGVVTVNKPFESAIKHLQNKVADNKGWDDATKNSFFEALTEPDLNQEHIQTLENAPNTSAFVTELVSDLKSELAAEQSPNVPEEDLTLMRNLVFGGGNTKISRMTPGRRSPGEIAANMTNALRSHVEGEQKPWEVLTKYVHNDGGGIETVHLKESGKWVGRDLNRFENDVLTPLVRNEMLEEGYKEGPELEAFVKEIVSEFVSIHNLENEMCRPTADQEPWMKDFCLKPGKKILIGVQPEGADQKYFGSEEELVSALIDAQAKGQVSRVAVGEFLGKIEISLTEEVAGERQPNPITLTQEEEEAARTLSDTDKTDIDWASGKDGAKGVEGTPEWNEKAVEKREAKVQKALEEKRLANKPGRLAMSNIRRLYMEQQIPSVDSTPLEAMRKVFSEFQPPKEAGPLNLVVEGFASAYVKTAAEDHLDNFVVNEDNPLEDSIYQFFFAVMMLNTDFQNDAVKVKMSPEDFNKQLTSSVTAVKVESSEFIADIYNELQRAPLKVPGL